MILNLLGYVDLPLPLAEGEPEIIVRRGCSHVSANDQVLSRCQLDVIRRQNMRKEGLEKRDGEEPTWAIILPSEIAGYQRNWTYQARFPYPNGFQSRVGFDSAR